MSNKYYRYENCHGVVVEVDETNARRIHHQMRRYLGCSDGTMNPPGSPPKIESTVIDKMGREVPRAQFFANLKAERLKGLKK